VKQWPTPTSLLLWEKKFEYKISKMLLDVCFDLSLWWHLPNQDIAFKQIKIVKILKRNCSLFCVPKIYTLKVQICYETFVLICHHSGTFLIRILCLKIVKIQQNCLLIIVFFLFYNRSKYVMCYHLHLFTIVYNYSISFMADITYSYNIVLIIF
jgi:hypothetical protein